MEDKELKKKLRKVPDVDASGEPIWKIESGAGGKVDKREAPNVIQFPGKRRGDRSRKP